MAKTVSRLTIFGLVGLIGLSGCNQPMQPRSTSTSTEPAAIPTDTPSPVQPAPSATYTLEPAPTYTPTPTLEPARVSPVDVDVSCRFGPGAEYSVEGALQSGETELVQGRNAPSTWWQIEIPRRPGVLCWVAASATNLTGNGAVVSIVGPPINFVTVISVELDPGTIDLNPCVFPTTFDVQFTIQVTGPTDVTFQRSLSNGDSAPVETVTFLDSTPQTLGDYYKVGAIGEHWFQVAATSPNVMTGVGYGTVTCP